MAAWMLNSQNKTELITMAKGVAMVMNDPIRQLLDLSDQLTYQIGLLHPDDRMQLASLTMEIQRLSFQCAEIINDLALYSQPKSKQMAFNNVNSIVDEVLLLVGPYFHNPQKILLTAEFGENIPQLFSDRNLLMQMLINLILHARHTITTEGEVQVMTDYDPETCSVILQVSDNGVELSAKVRTAMFDPFVSPSCDGMADGLKLPVVAGIVQLHGGTLWVNNGNQPGNTIRILLPTGTMQR